MAAKVRYDEAEPEVYDLLNRVLDAHFHEITALPEDDPLRIKVLMASLVGDDTEGPALKHHGVPVVALIRKSKAQDRAQGGPDVYIEIDANRWAEFNERRQMAVLSHELRHVELKRDKSGGIKRDVYERPVIKLVPDDWTLTGFRDVVEWYGEDAVEYQAVNDVAGMIVQLGLPFMTAEDMAEAGDRPRGKARGRRAAEAARGTSQAVIDETFTSLLSIGHTEFQARRMINRVLDQGRAFRTVPEMIEAIYLESCETSGPLGDPATILDQHIGRLKGRRAAALTASPA